MVTEVYKFNKTFEERLNEFSSILAEAEMEPSTSKILSLWSIYLEMSIEPGGWNALWNISRKCCSELSISFPTVVVVMVDYIDFELLTANVTITEVEDSEEFNNLPSKVNDIPLKQLFVTINQEHRGPDFSNTAECLDQYRLFYNHLWWPWDDDNDSDKEHWMSSHFLFRLQLYYDLIQGNVNYVTGKKIKALLERGKELFSIIDNLQHDLDEINNDDEMLCDSRMLEMIEYLNELDMIKAQLSRWENPDLRKILNEEINQTHSKCGVLAVIEPCAMSQIREYFDQIGNIISGRELFKGTAKNLPEAIQQYIADDKIFLSPGVHSIRRVTPLEFNVTVRGLHDTKCSIIDNKSCWCLFETIADRIVFHNFEINVNHSRYAVIVKRGTTYLDTICMRNGGRSSICSIIIHKGASLIATQSKFEKFNIAIVCTKGASLELMDCKFENNDVCILLENGGQLSLENCDFKKTSQVAIQFKGGDVHDTFGTFADLTRFEGVKINNAQITSTQKAVQFL